MKHIVINRPTVEELYERIGWLMENREYRKAMLLTAELYKELKLRSEEK